MNTPVKNLKVGVSFDYLGSTEEFSVDGTTFYANAWALYTSFQATEKLSLHLRGEYASTDTGLLDGGAGGFTPGANSEVVSLTGTIQYDLWANVLSRLEVRWDHQAGSSEMTPYSGLFPAGAGTGVAATENQKRNAVMIAANIIYKF
jgi:hypothetical protein